MNMNFDPSKMDPAQLKAMLNTFSGMSDEQIASSMKMMGVNMDPKVIRSFIDKMKGASDEDWNKLKEQYAKGSVNMNSFKPEPPSPFKAFEDQITEAKKWMDENKWQDSIDWINKTIENLKNEKVEEKDKEAFKVVLGKAYDQWTLTRYTMEDYDTTIAESLKGLEEVQVFAIYNRMGICYFKKGKCTKARDAFLKAKELFPNETDKIAEKYLKMALEEIENY